MNLRAKSIACIALLLLLSSICGASAATNLKIGDAWTFDYTAEITLRIPDQPVISSHQTTSMYIEIEDIKDVGGADEITYKTITTYGIDNHSITPENNYISFYCSAGDWNNDGYLESFYVYVSSSAGTFVDTDWSKQATSWENSINSVENEPGVTLLEHSASDGRFYAKLRAKYQNDYTGDYVNENGTKTIEIEVRYDSDGVLLSSSSVDRIEYDDGAVVETVTKMVRRGSDITLFAIGAAIAAILVVVGVLLKRRGKGEEELWPEAKEEQLVKEKKEPKAGGETGLPSIG